MSKKISARSAKAAEKKMGAAGKEAKAKTKEQEEKIEPEKEDTRTPEIPEEDKPESEQPEKEEKEEAAPVEGEEEPKRNGKFGYVRVKGGFRVYGRRGEWVSPVFADEDKAMTLAKRFNQ